MTERGRGDNQPNHPRQNGLISRVTQLVKIIAVQASGVYDLFAARLSFSGVMLHLFQSTVLGLKLLWRVCITGWAFDKITNGRVPADGRLGVCSTDHFVFNDIDYARTGGKIKVADIARHEIGQLCAHRISWHLWWVLDVTWQPEISIPRHHPRSGPTRHRSDQQEALTACRERHSPAPIGLRNTKCGRLLLLCQTAGRAITASFEADCHDEFRGRHSMT